MSTAPNKKARHFASGVFFVATLIVVCWCSYSIWYQVRLPPPFLGPVFNRDEFLGLLRSQSTPDIDDLRWFYRRPKYSFPPSANYPNVAAITELGKTLFFDPRLSASGKVACATCHQPEKHWIDGRPLSIEGKGRRAMCLYNIGWDRRWIWSGSLSALTLQAQAALSAPFGMNSSTYQAVLNIYGVQKYKKLFQDAFAPPGSNEEYLNPQTLLFALEYFVRSIVSPEAPFDRWVAGDKHAISDQAQHGFLLFNTKARCALCHNSWRFSDGNTYDIGLFQSEYKAPDGTTKNRAVATKAVGLREIAERSPYSSAGVFKSLNEVVAFYNRGGDFVRPTKSPDIRPLGLTLDEQKDLIAFLKTLSSGKSEFKRPVLPK